MRQHTPGSCQILGRLTVARATTLAAYTPVGIVGGMSQQLSPDRTPALPAEPVLAGVAAPRPRPYAAVRDWPRRRWLVAAGGAALTALAIGLPTAMIPNPVFGRAIPTTWWAWPVLVVTSVLAGLLGATYVRVTGAAAKASRSGMVGGLLSYFAVGCPVCNKIALLALGYTGALQWFAPIQPVLGVAALGLLAFALDRRLRGEMACPVA